MSMLIAPSSAVTSQSLLGIHLEAQRLEAQAKTIGGAGSAVAEAARLVTTNTLRDWAVFVSGQILPKASDAEREQAVQRFMAISWPVISA